MTLAANETRERKSKVWARDADDFYIEEGWVSQRLFDVERFDGGIIDPACGSGRIILAARKAGYEATGSDIKARPGQPSGILGNHNFLNPEFPYEMLRSTHPNIVCNPPFRLFNPFVMTALRYARGKIAMVWLSRRLAAAQWMEDTPLASVYLLRPRPAMPPGHIVLSGGKVGGGTQDFVICVWDRLHSGPPVVKWLHRDGGRDARGHTK